MKKFILFLFLFVGFQSANAQDTTKTTNAINSNNANINHIRVLPQFVGGEDSLYSYLQRNTIYPKSALDKNKHGTVYISFVISDSGKISEVIIRRGIKHAPELDSAAVNVVRNMPNWIPGKIDGKNVVAQLNIPIKFILDNPDKKK